MNRRVIGIILAVVLGIGGTFALVKYVQSARDDAAEPEPTESILVVQNDVAQGAYLDVIEDNVALEDVPERLVAPGALTDLDSVPEDLVAGVALEPGEQLLRSRLVESSELVSVDVPEGLQELTVAFDPERAVGGQVEPGESVGIVLSFEPFEIAASGPTAAPDDPAAAENGETAPTKTPNTTHLTLNKVLVTGVQLSRNDAERTTETRTVDEDSDDQPVIAADIAEAPGDQLLVTFAVSSPEAEQIVFAAEFGRIWLTGQNTATDESNTRILTLEQVYIEVPR
jgi:pilus assembly protein CpaB